LFRENYVRNTGRTGVYIRLNRCGKRTETDYKICTPEKMDKGSRRKRVMPDGGRGEVAFYSSPRLSIYKYIENIEDKAYITE
jgi:hypothetical protein